MTEQQESEVVVEQGGGQEAALEAQRQAEDKARSMGWRPKDEFRGDPSKWVDAAEFNRRGEEHIPILRDRLQRTQADLEETRKLAREALDMQREQQARERARLNSEIQALKSQQMAAVQAGDTAAYLSADQQIKAREAAMPAEVKAPAPETPQIPPEAREWVGRNPWFNSDSELAASAEAFHVALGKREPGLPLSENLRRTEEHIKRMFPEKFGNPHRSLPGAVEGTPAVGSGTKPRKKGYVDLPADAKAACDKYVTQKLMTRDQYVTDYFGEQA